MRSEQIFFKVVQHIYNAALDIKWRDCHSILCNRVSSQGRSCCKSTVFRHILSKVRCAKAISTVFGQKLFGFRRCLYCKAIKDAIIHIIKHYRRPSNIFRRFGCSCKRTSPLDTFNRSFSSSVHSTSAVISFFSKRPMIVNICVTNKWGPLSKNSLPLLRPFLKSNISPSVLWQKLIVPSPEDIKVNSLSR